MRVQSSKSLNTNDTEKPTELNSVDAIVAPTLLQSDREPLPTHQITSPDVIRLPPGYEERLTRVRLLGKGGSGVVYSAYDIELERNIVIKALYRSPSGVITKDFARQEARAIANLHHPGIVTLYDWLTDATGAWLILEYVPGGSLFEHVHQKGLLPVSEAIDLCIQVCDALQYAHDHGIWHLDVKPGNVLVVGDNAKVTDFGIAYRPNTGKACPGWGTPGYAAPEQLSGHPGPQSDVYAVGALLWAMLTGSLQTGVETITEKRRWRHIPSTLRPLLRGALSDRPEHRPSSPKALGKWMREVQAELLLGHNLTRRRWDILLSAICTSAIMAVLTGSSSIALLSPGRGIWLGLAMIVLGIFRPASSVILSLLIFTLSLVWRVPTLGVMMAMIWPVLGVLLKSQTRPMTIAILTPFLVATGLGGLTPVLAGALLPTVTAAWVGLLGTMVALGLEKLVVHPLVQSYLSAAHTALPLPTLFRQAITVLLQISPRDIVLILWPVLWQAILSPITLYIALANAGIAVGIAWARDRLAWSTMSGMLAALTIIGETVRVVFGGEPNVGLLLIVYTFSLLVVETAPGRVEANWRAINAWLGKRFPSRGA